MLKLFPSKTAMHVAHAGMTFARFPPSGSIVMMIDEMNNDPDKKRTVAEPRYEAPQSPDLDAALSRIDALKTELDAAKAARPELWPTVLKKLKVQWTTDSNAIEGSSLSFADTLFFLEQGLTVEGKPLKDFLDARNHAEAIELLFDVIANRRPISEGLIKEINALLLLGVQYTTARDSLGRIVQKPATPGQYKQLPNHVLLPDGTIHYYAEPLQVPPEMSRLCQWVDAARGKLHPVLIAAIAHYNFVRVHPFDDGNGRGARILMNLILMQDSYPPIVVANEERRAYLDSLRQADAGDIAPFISFIAASTETTLANLLKDLKA